MPPGALPDVVGLCPTHLDEFYVPHAGTCPEPGCGREMIEYRRVDSIESRLTALERAVAALPMLHEALARARQRATS